MGEHEGPLVTYLATRSIVPSYPIEGMLNSQGVFEIT